MKVILFDVHNFEKERFCQVNQTAGIDLTFYEGKLNEKSATVAAGFECVCAFVNDKLNAQVLRTLSMNGTRLIALRSAGFNHVDLEEAARLGLKVVRVPEYSPYSVAEHAMALILGLNRKIYRAYNRVREGNFSLEGLVGFDLHGKTMGVVGTGKIGKAFINIALGFGCEVLANDLSPDEQLQSKPHVEYVSLKDLLTRSDIISLHVPLTDSTRHMIDESALKQMKPGVMLINTSRGALIQTKALIDALKSGKIAAAGLDVYEEEQAYFFQDLSGQVMDDDMLARLMTFPNVLLTSHQGFLTQEALMNIAQTTLANITQFQQGHPLSNEVRPFNP